MRTSEVITLPLAGDAYTRQDDQTLRRTVEQAFQDLRSDVIEIRDATSRPASLAIRRHQFLLMGG